VDSDRARVQPLTSSRKRPREHQPVEGGGDDVDPQGGDGESQSVTQVCVRACVPDCSSGVLDHHRPRHPAVSTCARARARGRCRTAQPSRPSLDSTARRYKRTAQMSQQGGSRGPPGCPSASLNHAQRRVDLPSGPQPCCAAPIIPAEDPPHCRSPCPIGMAPHGPHAPPGRTPLPSRMVTCPRSPIAGTRHQS
jgi:hypothetical protein